jgi:hypothetical protein
MFAEIEHKSDQRPFTMTLSEKTVELLHAVAQDFGGCSASAVADAILSQSLQGLRSCFEIALHELEAKGRTLPKLKGKKNQGQTKAQVAEFVRTLRRYEAAKLASEYVSNDGPTDKYDRGNYV